MIKVGGVGRHLTENKGIRDEREDSIIMWMGKMISQSIVEENG